MVDLCPDVTISNVNRSAANFLPVRHIVHNDKLHRTKCNVMAIS